MVSRRSTPPAQRLDDTSCSTYKVSGPFSAKRVLTPFSLRERCRLRRGPDDSFFAGEREVVPAARAAEHGDADFLRDRVAHVREARARDEERDAHLRALDHHLEIGRAHV